MTLSHSLFIIALTVANIGGALWLLWWTRRSSGEASTTSDTTGHVWDEDLRELNNPLPRWWLWLFIITVLFGGHARLDFPCRTRGAVARQRRTYRAHAGGVFVAAGR